MTLALLELQRQVDQMLHDIGTAPAFDYFLPGQWIPHCILALEIEPEQLTRALNIGMRLTLPFAGQMTEIGVIEFRPVKERCVLQLRTAHAG